MLKKKSIDILTIIKYYFFLNTKTLYLSKYY